MCESCTVSASHTHRERRAPFESGEPFLLVFSGSEGNTKGGEKCAHCLLTNQRVCVRVLPECGNIVAGGPAHHKAPLWTHAALTHLIHVACRPHLAHTHLGLLLEVVG